jgi:alpha-L-fucosidase 2
MLIQSHENYIALLPALPKAWETGSYNGLVARGNFELSVNWRKSMIRSFKVTSKSGGKCRIKYKYIKGALIKDSDGKIVSHTFKSDNIIEFNTYKLSEYFITF